MTPTYDLYSENYQLIKADIKLTKKLTHKDLKGKRYVKIRIGTEPELFDYDALIKEITDLRLLVQHIQVEIAELQSAVHILSQVLH